MEILRMYTVVEVGGTNQYVVLQMNDLDDNICGACDACSRGTIWSGPPVHALYARPLRVHISMSMARARTRFVRVVSTRGLLSGRHFLCVVALRRHV